MLEVKNKYTRTTSKHISHLFLVVFSVVVVAFFLFVFVFFLVGGCYFEQACLLE